MSDRTIPGRHSLFWRLSVLLALFCIAMIGASHYLGAHITRQTSFLSAEARQTLERYAAEAAHARQQGDQALNQWRDDFLRREPGWAVLVDHHLQPLAPHTLDLEEIERLRRARDYERPLSRRAEALPIVSVPFGPERDLLVLRLPDRFHPWQHQTLYTALGVYLLPVVLSLLFGVLLYRMLISPLKRLSHNAGALSAHPLETWVPAELVNRQDELGTFGRSLDYLTQRLRDSVTQQRRLLRDLSHELRTPLSRLRVACESPLDDDELRARLDREVSGMQRLVDAVLELAWLDSEQPQFPCEPVNIASLWDLLCEDACFESGWPRDRLQADVPDDCQVLGHLNTLAHALENILRNAIRHSPPDGTVRLSAQRDGEYWQLCITDEGPGVPEGSLESIFQPFTRLNASRPGGDGYGLGLAIAQRLIHLQGGSLHARNGRKGLQQTVRLRAV